MPSPCPNKNMKLLDNLFSNNSLTVAENPVAGVI